MAYQRKEIINGFGWSSIERIITQGLRFILSFIVARQLLPSDYGLIAMLSIFLAVAQSFVDSGFSRALIQKKDRSQTDYSTVFYFNIVVAAFIYGLLLLGSPLIAKFYNQPILKEIIIWTGLNIIISAFATVQVAKLTVELNFKVQAQAAIITTIISGGIAVWMAYNGFGVWTLVWQTLIANFINVIIIWISAKWKPTMEFSVNSFKKLFSFGSKLLAGGLIHTIYTNLYSLVIGKFYAPTELGLFGNATTIATFPSRNVTEIVQKVVYPLECELQSDNEALKTQLFNTIKMVSLFLFPIMLGLAAICEPIIQLILTDKWIACTPFIRILCIAYMWDTAMRLNYTMLCAKGRTDLTLKSEIIKKIVAFIILFASVPFGISIMCWGLVVYSIADLVIITQYTKIVIPTVTFSNEMKIMMPIFAISATMAILTFSSTLIFTNLWLRVFMPFLIGIISYFILIIIFYKSEFQTICNLLKR